MADRAVVVTTAWGRSPSAFLVRRVSAALAMTAEVSVVVAEGHRGAPVEHADGPFWIMRVASQAPDLHRAALLRDALTAGAVGTGAGAGKGAGVGIPGAVRSELRRLAGSAEDLAPVLERLAPDSVVVADHRPQLALAVRECAGRWRTALLALAVDDLTLCVSGQDGTWDGWDAILATNAYEAELLRTSAGGRTQVRDLGVALDPPVAPGPDRQDLSSWVGDERWLVVLDAATAHPGCPVLSSQMVDNYLSLRLPRLTMVVVGPGRTTVVRGRVRRSFGALHRAALWELTAGAVALVDARSGQVLPREVLEAMMLSTPVIVPASSGCAQQAAEAGNGGLWYRDPAELAACVRRLLDGGARNLLGAQGRGWAAATHADVDSFVANVKESVLGPSS